MQKGNKNNLTVRVVASECKFDSIYSYRYVVD